LRSDTTHRLLQPSHKLLNTTMDAEEPRAAQSGWVWLDNAGELRSRFQEARTGPSTDIPDSKTSASSSQYQQPKSGKKQRHWKPRTCRICLETVLPTFHPPSENIPGIFQSTPSVTYNSEEGGRLIRPCKCKGTAQFVHEGCLKEWRHADPSYGRRNYYECPTCGFRYKLQRIGWGRMIGGTCKSPLYEQSNPHSLLDTKALN
jgi:hypothetical protein